MHLCDVFKRLKVFLLHKKHLLTADEDKEYFSVFP